MSIDSGEGHRLLTDGEILQPIDELHYAGVGWIRINPARVGTPLKAEIPHRRMLPKVSGTEAAVCADIAARQRLGVAKYGTTVKDNPLSLKEWLQHAYEECLDQAVYLRRAIDEA